MGATADDMDCLGAPAGLRPTIRNRSSWALLQRVTAPPDGCIERRVDDDCPVPCPFQSNATVVFLGIHLVLSRGM